MVKTLYDCWDLLNEAVSEVLSIHPVLSKSERDTREPAKMS